jgi:hypothetical protein
MDQQPIPKLSNTTPLTGQNNFLYSQVILTKELNGVLALFKLISVHDDVEGVKEDFKRADATNDGYPMKIGITGRWFAIRRPETDTDGLIDIVKVGPEEDNTFFGEDLKAERDRLGEGNPMGGVDGSKLGSAHTKSQLQPVEVLKDTEKGEEVRERAMIDAFKAAQREKLDAEKRTRLRKQALDELQEEIDDPTSLASYAQLHWKRLTIKSAITEVRDKLEEAQAALTKNLKELKLRQQKYPGYEAKWQDEIRRIQKLTMPGKAGDNPVDKPISNLGNEDDEELATLKVPEVRDHFKSSIGVDAKKKIEGKGSKGEVYTFGDEKPIPPAVSSTSKPSVVNNNNVLTGEELKQKQAELEKKDEELKVLQKELEEKRKAVEQSFLAGTNLDKKKDKKDDKNRGDKKDKKGSKDKKKK